MTRERILNAAYDLASVEGSSVLTYESVAAASGIDKGVIKTHFDNIKFLWAEVTYKRILDTAFDMVVHNGLQNLRRDSVAEEAGVSTGSVSWHFKTIGDLRDAVIKRAIECEELKIIAQGLAAGNEIAREAPEALKSKALKTFL